MADQRTSRPTLAEQIASELIDRLEAGTAPWQMPFKPGEGAIAPYNATTGKPYRGANSLWLAMQGRDDPRWLTFNQAKALGAKVRKGEHGSVIQYVRFEEERVTRDEAGNVVKDADGKSVKQSVRLESPVVVSAVVFNAAQIDGLPPLEPPAEQNWPDLEAAEQILADSGAVIDHRARAGAYYTPATDTITLPEKGRFTDAAGYYATALHELGHWSGHESRLARDLTGRFGSESYAKEELRAEIASMMIGRDLRIGHDPGQHAAYVKSWIKVLKEDPKEIVRAANDAEKIRAFVLTLGQARELGQQTNLGATMDQQPSQSPQIEQAAWDRALERVALDVDALEHAQRAGADKATAVLADVGEAAQADALYAQALQARAPHLVQRAQDALKGKQAVDPIPMVSMPGKTMVYNDQPGTAGAEIINEDGSRLTFGGKPGLEAFIADNNLADADATALRALEERAAPHVTTPQPVARLYFNVPYRDRIEAKAAGAAWDAAAKKWYAKDPANTTGLQRWLPKVLAPVVPAATEFVDALRNLGFDITEAELDKTGDRARCRVEGDKPREQSGFYRFHGDARVPAGYARNHRTGQEIYWKTQTQHYDAGELATLKREAQAAREAQRADRARVQQAVADGLVAEFASGRYVAVKQLHGASVETPYMSAKGIAAADGVYTDAGGRTLYVPAYNVDGELRTLQTITQDGEKRFRKDGQKAGCFHVVGGQEAIDNADFIGIAEGYATAATVAEALGTPIAAAFDAGNLATVAQALHAKHPDKPIVIFGDDDAWRVADGQGNRGREAAEAAAAAVDGVAVFPDFLRDEPPTAKTTDWNDLAHRDGIAMVRAQIENDPVMQPVFGAINEALEQQQQAIVQVAQRAPAMSR